MTPQTRARIAVWLLVLLVALAATGAAEYRHAARDRDYQEQIAVLQAELASVAGQLADLQDADPEAFIPGARPEDLAAE